MMRELGGQTVHDKPWHCSLCGRRFRRRVRIEFWDWSYLAGKGHRWTQAVVRLCLTDETVAGCADMGLGALFTRSKHQSRARRASYRQEEEEKAA